MVSKRFFTAATFSLLLLVPNAARGQAEGDPAPDFTYSSLDHGSVTLSDYRGKVVFLFLFGNQCPFCLSVGNRTETSINERFSSSGAFQAIGLDLWDSSSSVATVRAFKQRTGVTYPLALKAGDIAGIYDTTYDRVIVVDQEGIIRFKGRSNTASTLAEAAAVISSLIARTGLEPETGLPADFGLSQNYPNPFNPSTSISYSLREPGPVQLTVYNVFGRAVRTLVDRHEEPGTRTVTWNGKDDSGKDVASGIYLYRLQSADGTQSRVMTLVR